MFQLLLAHKGPTHTVQNGNLHLHVNKITSDDIREYTDLSITALVYVNFEQQKSESECLFFSPLSPLSIQSVRMIAHVVSV